MSHEQLAKDVSTLKSAVKEHKTSIPTGTFENEFKRKQLDIFWYGIHTKLKEINDQEIPEEVKVKQQQAVIDLATTAWTKTIKKKYAVETQLIGEKRFVNREILNDYLSQGIHKIDEEVLKDRAEEIKKIKFNGSFEMPGDFNDLMEQFDDAISDIESNLEGTKGKEKEKLENALFVLKKYKQNLEQLKNANGEKSTKDIEGRINGLIDQTINHKGFGAVKLNFFGIERTFANKAEALNTLEIVKKELADEFFTSADMFWQGLSGFYSLPLKLAHSLTIGEEGSYYDAAGMIGEGFSDLGGLANGEVRQIMWGPMQIAGGLGLGMLGVSALTSFLGLHRSPYESTKRRGFDIISKFSSGLQYEDYGKNGKTPMVDSLDTEAGRDYLEYKQREGLVEMFKQKLKSEYTVGSKEYNDYKKKIDILETFKLNKTNTFYYLAFKIEKGYDLGFTGNFTDPGAFFYNMKRTFLDGGNLYLYNMFQDITNKDKKWIQIKDADGKFRPKLGGFYKVPINRTKALYNETLNLLNKSNKNLEEGIKMFYENKEVTFEKSSEGDISTIKIKNKEGVDGDKKTKEYKYLQNYIKDLKVSEKDKKNISENFERYIKNLGDYPQSIETIKSDLFIILDNNYRVQDAHLLDIRNEIKDIEDKIKFKDKVVRNTPILRSFKPLDPVYKNMKVFQDLVYTKQWIGSEEEYKKVIADIKNNNFTPTENISTKLGGEKYSTKFDRILQRGEDILGNTNSQKAKLFNNPGEDLERSEKSQYLKNIEDFIHYKIEDNTIEESSKKELKDFLNKVLSGDIKLPSEDKLTIEVGKIISGGLPEYKVLKLLNDSIQSNLDAGRKTKFKEIIQDFINNPQTIISTSELNVLINDIKTSSNLTSISISTYSSVNISDIDNKINTSKEMRSRDIKNGLNELGKSKDDFFDEVIKNIGLDDTLTNKDEIIIEIQKLKSSTNSNRYTNLQIIHIIEEIQKGHKFSDISKVEEVDSARSLNDILKPNSIKLLKKKITKIHSTVDSFDDLEKLGELNNSIDEIKDNSYYKDLEKVEKNQLSDSLKTAQEQVENNFKKLTIDMQIEEVKKYKNTKSNYIQTILGEHIEITIDHIEKSSLTNLEKVEKAKELRRNINTNIDYNKIKSGIDNLIELEGIARLENSLASYEREAREQNPDQARLKGIMSALDKMYAESLADDSLRDRIDILKTEINGSVSTPEAPKETTKPTSKPTESAFETMSFDEKLDKINELFDRAHMEAELNINNLDENKVQNILSDIQDERDNLLSYPDKIKNFSYKLEESKLKYQLGFIGNKEFRTNKELTSIIDKAKKITKEKLIADGIFTKNGTALRKGALDTMRNHTEYNKLSNYIMRAFKTGG